MRMRTQILCLTALALGCIGNASADNRLGAADVQMGDPGLSAESLIGPLNLFACGDPENILDLRCSLVANQIGPDGAMYVYAPQPVPTGEICYPGDFRTTCQRRSIYRRRIGSQPELIAYVDERRDSDGANSHLSEFAGIYLDPVTCDLYFVLETYCLGLIDSCALYDPALELIRIHGLKAPKCFLKR